MYSYPTQQEIGERIAQLRRLKGFSQDELAKSIQLSRPSLTQIELGNRSVDIRELYRISHVLGFSLDEFMAENFSVVEEPLQYGKVSVEKSSKERNAIPVLNREKFKNIILYLLECCAGKPNVGETVLYKLLYFSDFNYYELYEEQLSGASYKKLPFGPVPQKIDAIIQQLIDEEKVQRIKTSFHGFSQTRYLPLAKADLTQLLASEKTVIDQVIDQMSEWSAATISAYSHLDIPWKVTKDGEEINYETVFYREAPFTVRQYPDETVDN